MKKTFLLLLFMSPALWMSFAFSYQNQPYGYSPVHNHPPSTPVPNPTYAVPPPVYKTGWGTAGGPSALALGAGTTVYVAEGDGSVALVEVFDSNNPSAPLAQWTGFGSTPFRWPGGVAVNPLNNNIYVSDNLNNALYEFTAAGVTVNSWSGYGGRSFLGPEGIGIDPSGNVYVADTGNDAVEEFDPAGNPLHQLTGGGGLHLLIR